MKHQCANGVARPLGAIRAQQLECARPTIAHTITEQKHAAGRWWIDDEHPGAWDGLCDWLMEECLMTLEASNAPMD